MLSDFSDGIVMICVRVPVCARACLSVWLGLKPFSALLAMFNLHKMSRNTMENPVHGPLVRYVKLMVAHALWMLGTFSPPPRVSDPGMYHGAWFMQVPWCMPGSLTSGIVWSRGLGKRFRHSRCMRNPQFYVSVKRHIETPWCTCDSIVWVPFTMKSGVIHTTWNSQLHV